MSRCLPYPPPGYTKEVIHLQALMDSVKLQREGEQAKNANSEKLREYNENKARENGSLKISSNKKRGKDEVSSHKKRDTDERNQEAEKNGCHRKRRKLDLQSRLASSLRKLHLT